METKKYEVEGPKEAVELAEAFEKFGKAMHTALKDGWQVGQDLPVILSSAMADLAPGFQGLDQLKAEGKADPVGLSQAMMNAGANIAKAVLAKDEAPQA